MTKQYQLLETGHIAGGRITIWGPPPTDTYCALGLDFAYGLPDGDDDAGVILNGRGEQLLTVQGKWGSGFYAVLRPILDWYRPFVVGERQVGLPILRQIYDSGYGWLYFDRNMAARGRPRRDSLGHHAAKGDLIIPWLRESIASRDSKGELLAPELTLHDAELHDQLTKFQFIAPSSTQIVEETHDEKLKWDCPRGTRTDLIFACAYANAGLRWLPEFDPPAKTYETGTMGMLFHMDEEEPDKDARDKLAERYK